MILPKYVMDEINKLRTEMTRRFDGLEMDRKEAARVRSKDIDNIFSKLNSMNEKITVLTARRNGNGVKQAATKAAGPVGYATGGGGIIYLILEFLSRP